MIVGNYTYTTVTAGTGDEAGIAAAAGLRLMGYSIKETAGAVATLLLRHGDAATDTIMLAENFAAAGSVTRWFGPQGLPVQDGVFIERLTGTTAVTLWTTVMT
jgi:hypothetical protein